MGWQCLSQESPRPKECPPPGPHCRLWLRPAILPQVTGGGPMLLSGNVVLCSRADADTQRHFDGQLAYLGK